MRRFLLLAFLVFTFTPPLAAQNTDLFLVTDLNDLGVATPFPMTDFLPAGDAAVFVKEEQPAAELWVTDGTVQGTRRLPTDCDPCSGLRLVAGDGSRVFFEGNRNEVFGVTDGTPSGTRTLLVPNTLLPRDEFVAHFSNPPVALGDKLFFVGEDFDDGAEPWVTDGTPEGTLQLKDVFPGREDSHARFGAVLNNRVLFVARTAQGESGLWRTDGTPEGTVQIRPGAVSVPFRLGSRALFFLEDEIWSTDGTAAGTRRVAPRPADSFQRIIVGDLAFFGHRSLAVTGSGRIVRGSGSVWRTDGTAEGTFELVELEGPDSFIDILGRAGDALLFFEMNLEDQGVTLWRSDGSVAGTFPVETACAPECRPRLSFFPATNVGDHLFFGVRDPETGIEPWMSDGTVDGTRPVGDLCPGRCSSHPEVVVRAADALYVAAHHPVAGEELYRVQPGSPPERLTSFVAAEPFVRLPFPRGLHHGIALPQGPLFTALDADTGLGVYRAESMVDSTEPLVTLGPADGVGSSPAELLRVGDDVVFTATDGVLPRRLWRTAGFPGDATPLDVLSQDPEEGGPFEPRALHRYPEGFIVWALGPQRLPESFRFDLLRWTTDGTVRLGSELPGVLDFHPPATVVAEDRIFFASQQEELDLPWRLWTSDGTPGGVRGLRDFEFIRTRFGTGLESVGSRVAFVAIARPDGPEALWISDGTVTGTRPIFEAPQPGGIGGLVATQDRLYFTTDPHDGEERLFVLLDAATGGSSSRELTSAPEIVHLVPMGSRLLFTMEDRSSGEGLVFPEDLWITDGTRAGTRFVASLDGDVSFSQLRTAILGDTAYLLVQPRGQSSKILATDGTPAGTRSVDLLPEHAARPTDLVAVGNLLVLVTRDEGGIQRLWVSEGGTEPAQRLEPGFVELDLSELTRLDNLAIFPADDGDVGSEPWALFPDLTPPPTDPCDPTPRNLCLTDGRFRVQVEWRDPRSGDAGRGFVVPQSQLDDSGFFWFFEADNVELVVKVLDARPVNGHFWVFSGSLTDVERTITVTDTQTGAVRTYHREAGDATGQIDVTAF